MTEPVGQVHARRWAVRIAAVVPLVVAAIATEPSAVGAQSAAQTVAFQYTGKAQTWTVPAGITQATFNVAGAQGGKGAFDGGRGALVVATIPLTPGETIQINVGGKGLDKPPKATACILVTNTGGWNGGGDGGNNGNCGSQGGGGASDVRVGGTGLSDRWIVAGGGGGGSGNLFCDGAGGGGNPIGGWGSCSGAGAGGDLEGKYGSGQQGQGSVGADPDGLSGPGGGGGGGYYGAGGGQPGLAGGGGSSYGPANAVYTGGTNVGNGAVTVTFGGSIPTITGVRPYAGSTGDTLTITGTNLSSAAGPTQVSVGETAQQTATCAGAPPATSCTVPIPGVGPQGAGDTYVTVDGQQNERSEADQFIWVRPASITSITPASAPSGADVTVAGDGMVPGAMSFTFGSVAAPVKGCNEFDSCIVQVPAGLVVGAVPVVAQRVGAPNPTAAATFTVVPSIVALTPSKGAAGIVVKITGSGFSTAAGATTITFGGVAAEAVGCDTTTSCTAVAPAGSGAQPVRVTVAGLESPDTANDQFTYATAEDASPEPADPAAVVPFASGGAQLGGDADAALQAALAAIQAAAPDSPVLVEGHADSAGDDEYNADLSRQRAQAVADWLVEQGVAPERLNLVGRGEAEPATSNDTADGRARNRRVEVAVEPVA